MRLVCDSCQAAYTIDDGLVGARDFRASCKACGEPMVVRRARQVAATQRMLPPGASLPPPSHAAIAAAPAQRPRPGPSGVAGSGAAAVVAPARSAGARLSGAAALAAPPAPALANESTPAVSLSPETAREGWYVALDGLERGPLSAQQIAAMLERGSVDWGTQVWRHGLKGWRAARRDAQLVTAVAGVRGVASDTTRLGAARSFVAAPGDTLIDGRARIDATGMLRKQRPTPPESIPLTPRSLVPGEEPLPDLRPSPPPQAWHSPENAAFRAALGLPEDSTQERLPRERAPHGASPDESSDSAQAAVSARSARSRSLALVAAISFTAGVLTSTAWERIVGRAPAVTDVARAAPAHEREEMALPAQGAPGSFEPDEALVQAAPEPPVERDEAPVQAAPVSQTGAPELPTVEQLRAGVRGVTGEVRRCIDDPAAGVDVDIYLDGPSGRVRDVDVRSPLVPPARVDCIQHAVRRMQVSPFTRPELKLMHKFRW